MANYNSHHSPETIALPIVPINRFRGSSKLARDHPFSSYIPMASSSPRHYKTLFQKTIYQDSYGLAITCLLSWYTDLVLLRTIQYCQMSSVAFNLKVTGKHGTVLQVRGINIRVDLRLSSSLCMVRMGSLANCKLCGSWYAGGRQPWARQPSDYCLSGRFFRCSWAPEADIQRLTWTFRILCTHSCKLLFSSNFASTYISQAFRSLWLRLSGRSWFRPGGVTLNLLRWCLGAKFKAVYI